MVLRVDVVDRAVEYAKSMSGATNSRVILLQASGEQLVQKKVYELAALEHLILICGHYEGVDHRVAQKVAHESISIGKYVLSGGEIPAMVVVDAVTRLMPGVLGNEASLVEESFNVEGEKEYPQFTRPKSYRGWVVPEILTGGDHAKIKQWREEA
jgi:tRNA (guanine37-N1)-methyltransferase